MKPRFSPERAKRPKQQTGKAFTLTELLLVLLTVSFLAPLELLTVAASRPNTAAIHCQNNHRQLVMAWTLYADENRGKLACNRDGGNVGKAATDAAWVGGWLDYTSNTDNTNVSLLVDHQRWPYGAYLGPYLHSPSVFKCPADTSVANAAPGHPLPRVRSVSMNSFIGQLARTWTHPSKYSLYRDIDQITSPAQILVLLDERADSINDGCFMTNPDTRWNIIDSPAGYHDGGCTFSFCDTHVEIHKWLDPRTQPPLIPGNLLPLNSTLPGDPDIDWLDEHASQLQ
jgi:prepilin-type processing-associated H-X9-DG protein